MVIMRSDKRLSVSLVLWLFFVAGCGHTTQAQTPLKTIANPQGGIIVYGQVAGATSQAAAMGFVLRSVHNDCGERPQVGNIFQVRGTNSVAVFFTVVNRTHGNKPVAGMVIAAQTGSNQFEAGLVSDSADRFSQTINPMLQQLFGTWHPGGSPAASTGSGGSGSAPTPGSAAGSPIPLHRVSAADNSVALSVPVGWTVNPNSGRGAIIVMGTNGEQIGLGMNRGGIDPTNPFRVRMAQQHYSLIPPGTVVYAFRGDVTKEFTNLIQAWRKAGGQGPARLQITSIQPMPTSPGNHCAQASGQMDPDGRGMQAFRTSICASDPTRDYGSYSLMVNHALFPLAVVEKDKDLFAAILKTYQPNLQVINQEDAALLKQKQQSDQQMLAWGQQYVNQIHQIGQQATARMNATEAANDAQHAGYWAQQDANAKHSAGFSNYLLDQTVIQDNNRNAHGTVWNQTADALVRSNPNRFSIVQTPNFWKGIDY
jgi:hypothetical protein